jgi:glycosyltransferase involved in cell wall biosynthesis
MNIIYFSPYDILRPRTNQVSDIRFCEAFIENNCSVELFVPKVNRKDNLPEEHILKVYEVSVEFKINYLQKEYLHENLSKIDYLKMSFLHFKTFLKSKKKNQNYFVVSRSEILLLFSILYKKIMIKKTIKNVIWLHELRKGKIHRFIYKNSDFILATNSKILHDLKKLIPKEENKMGITLNPISENQLSFSTTKEAARNLLNIPLDQKLIVYTGKLFINQEEINFIIEAAKTLKDFNFIFTGGKPDVISYYKERFRQEKIDNIRLTAYFSDYKQIKYYQKAADLLISYYTKSEHDVNYNFPNKICEYMLSGNPIITPFFPATEDVLKESNAFQVEAENSKALADRIKEIFANETQMKLIGENALKTVGKITYKNVTKDIVKLFNND